MNQNEQMREAIVAMVEDGWLHCGAEGMSDAQQKVYDAYREITAINCEYCGGNDETPQDHCVDCERPQALASEPAPNHIPDATKMVEPAKLVRLTDEEIACLYYEAHGKAVLEIHYRDAFNKAFANAIMDALEAKNGGKG